MAGPVVVIDRELLKSSAFRTLPQTAIIVLMDFLMKRRIEKRKTRPGERSKERTILNNGEIEYCYSEAEKKGIPRQSFARNLDALIERGFIDLTHSGAGGKKGDKSLYAISDRWREWGKNNFVPAKRPKDHRKGQGFAAVWENRKKIGNAGECSISNTNETRKAV